MAEAMGARRTDVRAAWASRVGARRMHESAEPAVAPPYAHKHVDTRSSGRCSSPSSQRSRSGLSQFDPREFVSREAGGSQRVCAAPFRCRFHDTLLNCETRLLSPWRFSRACRSLVKEVERTNRLPRRVHLYSEPSVRPDSGRTSTAAPYGRIRSYPPRFLGRDGRAAS